MCMRKIKMEKRFGRSNLAIHRQHPEFMRIYRLFGWLLHVLNNHKNNKVNGHYNGIVTARVTADPLPQGVSYREAIVRFEIPGDYKDYKFTQGENPGPVIDPIDDPSIADVNAIINIILGAEPDPKYDLNRDGTINIADVNVMIDIILTH